jgi:hypothetical protein
MSSPRTPKDPKDKWWNEYPLEGDPRRPAVIFTNLMSKSPRLIGWNDERIERRALEALAESKAKNQDTSTTSTPSEISFVGQKEEEEVKEVSFGLLNVVANKVTQHLLNLEVKGEGTTDTADEKNKAGNEEEKGTMAQSGKKVPQPLFGDKNTRVTMRDTELYKLALRSVEWQRDNYLVGQDYADRRRRERRQDEQDLSPELKTQLPPDFRYRNILYDSTALGNQQLAGLFSWFIPSPVVHQQALGLVLSLPSGPLNEPILKATVNLVPMAQTPLDTVVKNSILWFLKDDHWKDVIKRSAHGYIAQTYRDSPR